MGAGLGMIAHRASAHLCMWNSGAILTWLTCWIMNGAILVTISMITPCLPHREGVVIQTASRKLCVIASWVGFVISILSVHGWYVQQLAGAGLAPVGWCWLVMIVGSGGDRRRHVWPWRQCQSKPLLCGRVVWCTVNGVFAVDCAVVVWARERGHKEASARALVLSYLALTKLPGS